MQTIKEEAKKVIDHLPETATWDDIMYEIYVKQKLANAIKAADEDRIMAHEEVKNKFISK